MRLRTLLALPLIPALALVAVLQAQSPGPQPLPYTVDIPAPRDVPYAGTIRLSVDTTNIAQHIMRVHETIPVRGGDAVTLLYPLWLPGNHGPRGRLDWVGGFTVRANGQRIPWTRDPVEVFAFHVR